MQTKPKYKICRRLGDRVFSKCQTTKFTISGTEKRSAGKKRRRPLSEYGAQLLEKQKAKYTYGLRERQFANYIKATRNLTSGSGAENLFKFLERRMDNVVYRLGFANSRAFARQLISHGHIMLNNRRVTTPSYQVRIGDQISIRPGSKDSGPFKNLAEKQKDLTVPAWITYDAVTQKAAIVVLPSMSEKEAGLNFNSILEFYSRV
ncbi:MAG: 30S ribosomal protein S4 [Patescibacteria group bacterium]